MKVVISGYGKMGKMIERICLEEKIEISAILNQSSDWEIFSGQIAGSDVIIDFSQPDIVISNIEKAFSLNKAIIVGTTGWHHNLDYLKNKYKSKDITLIYGSNFSIGVNIFFQVNKLLAELMGKYGNYQTSIEEVHHTEKLDSPSGTAITLAQDIIGFGKMHCNWVNEASNDHLILPVISKRISNTPGTHIVTYKSQIDQIELIHTAHNREGFARGAILAAKMSMKTKGFHDFNQILFN